MFPGRTCSSSITPVVRKMAQEIDREEEVYIRKIDGASSPTHVVACLTILAVATGNYNGAKRSSETRCMDMDPSILPEWDPLT
jgi:hypothetical protein